MQLRSAFIPLMAVMVLSLIVGRLFPDTGLGLAPVQLQIAELFATLLCFILSNEGIFVFKLQHDIGFKLGVIAQLQVLAHALANGTSQP